MRKDWKNQGRRRVSKKTCPLRVSCAASKLKRELISLAPDTLQIVKGETILLGSKIPLLDGLRAGSPSLLSGYPSREGKTRRAMLGRKTTDSTRPLSLCRGRGLSCVTREGLRGGISPRSYPLDKERTLYAMGHRYPMGLMIQTLSVLWGCESPKLTLQGDKGFDMDWR